MQWGKRSEGQSVSWWFAEPLEQMADKTWTMKWTLDRGSILWKKREQQRASMEPDEDADLQAEDAEEEEDDVSDLQAEDDDDEEERTMQITSWRPKKTKKRTKKHNRNSASSLKRAALRNALRALQL
jgi:hypothetical protein